MEEYEGAYAWLILLLKTTETRLPYATAEPILASVRRRIFSTYPALKASFDDDQLDADEILILDEAIGYKAAASWLLTLPIGKDAIVLRQELLNGLLEQYQGFKPEDIAARFLNHADETLGELPDVATEEGSGRTDRVYGAVLNPTRTSNATRDTLFGRHFIGTEGNIGGDEF